MSVSKIAAVAQVIIIAQCARSPDYIIGLTTGKVFRKNKEHLYPLPPGGTLKGRLHLFVKIHSQHFVYAREDKSLKSIECARAQVYILLRPETGQIIQKPLYRVVFHIHLLEGIEDEGDRVLGIGYQLVRQKREGPVLYCEGFSLPVT